MRWADPNYCPALLFLPTVGVADLLPCQFMTHARGGWFHRNTSVKIDGLRLCARVCFQKTTLNCRNKPELVVTSVRPIDGVVVRDIVRVCARVAF